MFDPHTETFEKIGLDDKINKYLVGLTNIIFDSDRNRVWLFGDFGLYLWNRKTKELQYIFSSEPGSHSLKSNYIFSSLDDGHGIFWIGTNDGLYSYNSKTGENTRYSLFNDSIHGVVQDKQGNIWASTNAGLSCIERPSMNIRNFDAGDGLPFIENIDLAMYCGKEGAIYVGGHNGFYSFHPDSIHTGSTPPSVVITSLRIDAVEAVFDKSITELSSVTLPYRKAPLTLEFSALDFANPAKNTYAYKMEGMNGNWINAGSQRKVTYSNLEPGSYTFRVKAANSQGVWNEEGVSLRITIIPPFHKTIWFKLIIITTLVGIFYTVHELRIIAIKHQREQLKKLVDRQTEDLKNANLKLQQIAITDELTQISNRRFFNQYFESQWKSAVREHTQLSLILGDIDYFKKYNDFYGHQKGDECLYRVAQTLKNQLKRPEDFIARYGGEEFIIVLPKTPLEGARHIADSLIDGIRTMAIPHEKSDVETVVTLSLGVVSVFPSSNVRPETLTKIADDALYEAKNQGRNRAVCRAVQLDATS